MVGESSSDSTAAPVKVTSGAAHVLVSGGYAGPEGLTGQKVSYTTSTQSAAITGTLIDITCTTTAQIAVAANPTAAVATGYYCAAGVTYRLPITTGNKVAIIHSDGSTAGVAYIHPVA